MRTLLCLGLGYTAEALARRLEAQGFAIVGTSRSAEGAAAIAARGWKGLAFAGAGPSGEVAAAIPEASHILVSVPPDADGDPVLRSHAADIAAAAGLAWIGYLSTIGVYGDHAGGWVDETTPPAPGNARSRYRLAAEAAWLELGRSSGRRVEVFRLPGIYGPGRSAIDSLRAGTARRIAKPGQVFNRMHVADIAAVLEAAFGRPHVHAIYNLADDEPAPPEDVITYAAELLGLAPPPIVPFAEAHLSPMAQSFYAETKRVSNARMKAALGIRLRYPTYREGLAAIIRGED
jgi:nucleoside-diphosphate-sugar epimerase